jgi:hypothetical protein
MGGISSSKYSFSIRKQLGRHMKMSNLSASRQRKRAKEDRAEKLRMRAVMDYLGLHPRSHRSALEEALGMDRKEASQRLYALESRHVVERTSSNPPLWSLVSASQSRDRSLSTDEFHTAKEPERAPAAPVDLLLPVALLHSMVQRNLLLLTFNEKLDVIPGTTEQSYTVEAVLSNPEEPEQTQRSLGLACYSFEEARYSASLGLLRDLAELDHSACQDQAKGFIERLGGDEKEYLPPKTRSFTLTADLDELEKCLLSPTIYSPLKDDQKVPESLPASLPTAPQVTENVLVVRTPAPLDPEPLTPAECESLYTMGEMYRGEEGALLEFKGSNSPVYDFAAFSRCFNSIAWETISSYINLHASEVSSSPPTARIIFGVHDLGYVQGIRFHIPPGYTKEVVLRQKRDEFSLRLVSLADRVQPREMTKYVKFLLHEVVLPEGGDPDTIFSQGNRLLPQKRKRGAFLSSLTHFREEEERGSHGIDCFYALAEIRITIPEMPTVCSYHDTFYYRQPNAGCTRKMTLQQLHSRFTHPSFRLT